ncbi:MAG: hypothetical protein AWM53_00052 [Candidatus Dichloromethanomonas elyunquensis]|nr:MAG: hypothetical protein AWM53_00052 [Candidatus Dichloromethanomonas elyunquensis]
MIYEIAEAMLTFEAMTNEKLQKLCYFAYAWYLTFFGERLFEEKFEAWENGPTCPELFEKYQLYGRMQIPRVQKRLDKIIEKKDLQEFLEAVYDAHGSLKTEELVLLTRSEEPWIKALQRKSEKGDRLTYGDDDIINWNTKKVLKELNRENITVVYNILKQL